MKRFLLALCFFIIASVAAGPLLVQDNPFLGTWKLDEIRLGATVRRQVVHTREEKSVQMVRVASGQLVYNVPSRMLVDERKSE